MKYSIDTSALMDGWVRYYPPDVFPALWDKIDGSIETGDLAAIEEVRVELEKKEDDLFEWAKQRDHLFHPLDEEIQEAAMEILASHEKLLDTRRGRSAADPFVIAFARVHRCTVITGERATNSPTKPHIPDVCRDLGISCIDMLTFIRQQRWTFQ